MNTHRGAAEFVDVQSTALGFCASISRWRIQFREMERRFGLDDEETKRRAFRWELSAYRFKSALLRYVAALDGKAGFRQDQPRDEWGRWSGGAGSLPANRSNEPSDPRRSKRDGHHIFPRTHWRKLPFSKQALKVFDNAKTGPLHFVHGWDEPHARYNEATKELTDRFIHRNNIQPEQMTAEQARSLIKEIHESRDPIIRNFNMKIRLREYLHRVRVRMRGNEQETRNGFLCS